MVQHVCAELPTRAHWNMENHAPKKPVHAKHGSRGGGTWGLILGAPSPEAKQARIQHDRGSRKDWRPMTRPAAHSPCSPTSTQPTMIQQTTWPATMSPHLLRRILHDSTLDWAECRSTCLDDLASSTLSVLECRSGLSSKCFYTFSVLV